MASSSRSTTTSPSPASTRSVFYPGYLDAFKGAGRQALRAAEGRQHPGHGLQRRPADESRRDGSADRLAVAPGRGRRSSRPEWRRDAAVPVGLAGSRAGVHLRRWRRPVQRRQDGLDHRHARVHRRDRRVPRLLQGRGRQDAPATSGDDWCGKSLGEQHAAIIFEGGWLDPYMGENYKDIKYAVGGDARGPGRQGHPRLHRRLRHGRRCQEQGRLLGPDQLPDRPRGHEHLDGRWHRQPVPFRPQGWQRQGDPRRGRRLRQAVGVRPGLLLDQRRVQQRVHRRRPG